MLCVAAMDGKVELLPIKDPLPKKDGRPVHSSDEGFWIESHAVK